MSSAIPASDAILSQIRQRVLGFVAARAPRDVAEDIAQESLLLLTTKYAHLHEAADLVPLSLRIARFKLMNHWRKSRVSAMVAIDDPESPYSENIADEHAEGDVARRLLLRDLLSAIDRLGERCRALFELKLEGHDFEEIRRRLKAASINTVYTWDNRCRKQLREDLAQSWSAVAGA
jgi:RNA polymerase sigma-70 factor, ECF subfamily